MNRMNFNDERQLITEDFESFKDLTALVSLDNYDKPDLVHGYFQGVYYKFVCRANTIDMNSLSSYWMEDKHKFSGLISSDDYVVDIGSYAGSFGIGVALETGCKSLLIEAVKPNHEIIEINILLNEIGDRVSAKHLALSSEKLVDVIRTLDDDDPHRFIGHSSCLERYRGFNYSEMSYDADVNGSNINEIFNDIESCKFLKMDCAGGEISFLNDVTKDTLSKIEYISASIYPVFGAVQDEFLESVNSFDGITFAEYSERTEFDLFLKKE